MGLDVYVYDELVDITFTGLDRWLCLCTGVQLPMDEIVAARVAPVGEMKRQLGWRVGGGYFPGWFATGWYLVDGGWSRRQLWDVFRDQEVLVIDTRRDRPCRLVLQHPDRRDLAWYIGERLGAR